MTVHKSDFLVIGSGISGLFLAELLSKIGRVNVVTKREIRDGNTQMAQGGIAVVSDPEDDFENHVRDTLNTGHGLCDEKIVRTVVEAAPGVIRDLMSLGVKFSRENRKLDLSLEGGHSRRRILHAGDYTGREIENALVKKCLANSRIKIFPGHMAVDLILDTHPSTTLPYENSCLGAHVLKAKVPAVENFIAAKTVVATGGAGKTYLYSSNSDAATGDGMAMAFRAGLKLVNMEFIQFHPTCLYHPKAKNFLISEAVRGEGGILKLKSGKEFMRRYSPMKELAPRDIVAKAIDMELKKSGDKFILLDITHKSESFLRKRFPTIYSTCKKHGINIARQPIPVVPAAHFFCGGIEVDDRSRTKIKNLYAVGEASYTGLHGANRLASNSLLEGAVFAKRAFETILGEQIKTPRISGRHKWYYGNAREQDEMIAITHNWEEIRTLMWNYVAIIRSDKRLERAKSRIDIVSEEIMKYYWDFLPTRDLLELRNIACVAKVIINSALLRKESRGLHFNIDWPKKNPSYEKNTETDRYRLK